jgi:hypothetical protein
MIDRLVRAGATVATLLSAHTIVNALLLRRLPAAATVAEGVSLLVPARNEAGRIGPCLASLLAQQDLVDAEVLVFDDASSDDTAAVVRAVGGDRVRLCPAAPLPPGWLGKPWACSQLAAAASGSVLVFIDADVQLAPDAVARTVRLLREGGFGFLSPYPRQLADGVLPRLVQPLLQWSWLTFLPLRIAERAWAPPSMAVANGQLLAVDRTAYTCIGGHGAVRAAVLEDLAIARALRRAGYPGGVVDGTSAATCRMYGSAGELFAGYTKSAWAAFGSPLAAGAVTAGAVAVYLLPPLAALRGSRAGLIGFAAAGCGRLVAAARTGGRWAPDPLAQPLSIATALVLLAWSYRGRARGALSWKGRRVG